MTKLDLLKFTIFYEEHYKQSFLFAKSYVREDMIAEDIASEALFRLWKLAQSEDIDNAKAALFAIIKNMALDHLKHIRVKDAAIESMTDYAKRDLEIRITTLEATNPHTIFANDVQKIIEETISKLPEQTREIFEKNRFENMSKSEIAELYGITIKGVDYHLYKAIVCLKKKLADYL